MFTAELSSLVVTAYEDIDLSALDGRTLVGHGVNPGISVGFRDPNLCAHRQNTGIGGDGGSRNGLLALGGQTPARVGKS